MSGGANKGRVQSMASLQLLAILVIVLGHLWLPYWFPVHAHGVKYVMAIGVCFCFVYSGFFTARSCSFGPDYGWREHLGFMKRKLIKLYPVHFIALILCVAAFYASGVIGGINIKPFLACLLMVNSFVPSESYYFAYNAVSWFACVIMFIYLVAPLVVKALRKLSLRWQLALIALAVVVQYVGGYFEIFDSYLFYQFPPMRVIDFAAGVVMFNVTQTDTWRGMCRWLTPARATSLELSALLLAAPLCLLFNKFHDPLWFRSFAVMVLPMGLVFVTFVLTMSCNGMVSRLISTKPFAWLSKYSTEIFFLQLAAYFTLNPLLMKMGVKEYSLLAFVFHMAFLILLSVAVNRLFRRFRHLI